MRKSLIRFLNSIVNERSKIDLIVSSRFAGLYGTLFRRNKEAAFSNYRLWESAGFVIAYAYSTHLCARMKLYVMLTVLLIGTIGYIIVELLHRRKQKRLKAIAEDPKAAQAEANQVEETDDEKDDIDDDIIITHLWSNITMRTRAPTRNLISVSSSSLLLFLIAFSCNNERSYLLSVGEDARWYIRHR